MSRRAWTLAVAGLLISSVSAAWLLAEPGVVVTKDGTHYEGDVRESDDSVTIVIRGVEAVIPRANIERIEYGDFEKEFREQLDALGDNDVPGRVALARSAFERRRYDLAREALNEALRIDPNSREATDMLELVEKTMRLERAGGAQPAGGSRGPGPATRPAPPAGPRAAPGERRLLTADDINTIRQKELQPTDTGVRITFQGDVKKRYVDANDLRFNEFNRLPPIQQALEILARGDEDMRRQVRITSDPMALAEYKRSVQPVVLSGCSTSACHGGPGGGGLLLYAPADSDAVAYTNFYILTQFQGRAAGRDDRGMFGSSTRKLIERGRGDSALLTNYGLPTNLAEFDHPPVGGKPVQSIFRNKSDPRYEQIVHWMNDTLVRIEPEYGIEFPLPRAAPPVTAPTTEPSR